MSLSGEPAGVELEWWGGGTIPPQFGIVWCAFPYSELPDQPGPKPRPALVVSARYAEEPPTDRFELKVVYGTSTMKSDERPLDFSIVNYTTLNLLRLPQQTRFDMDRVLWLPWAKPYFVPREERGDAFTTPVISVLPAELQRELGWLMRDRDRMGLNKAFNEC